MLPFVKMVTLKRVADIKKFVNGNEFPVRPTNNRGYTQYTLANEFIIALCHKEITEVETMFGEYRFPSDPTVIYPYLKSVRLPRRLQDFKFKKDDTTMDGSV